MTFEAILLGLTLFSGLVVLIHWWKQKNSKAMFPEKEEGWLVDYSKSLFPVFLIVLLLRSFACEPFRIPSGSLYPPLEIGDFILVDKHAYGLNMPVFYHYGWRYSQPKRGEVVVFRYPNDPNTDYIKRVVGLPGDEISVIEKQVYINGTAVVQKPLGTYHGKASGEDFNDLEVRQEQFPGEAEPHQILIDPESISRGVFNVKVPPGHFFVMGDNRDHSNDSRYWGFVPEENIKGKAFYIWLNWDHGLRFDRIGTPITE